MHPPTDVVTYQDDWSVLRPDFFGRPPARSYLFIAGTLMLLVSLAVIAVILVRHWNDVRPTTLMLMGLAVPMVALWWFAIYQIFQRLHEIYSQAKPDPSFVRSPIEKVFRLSGALMSATLFWPILAALYLVLAFGGLVDHVGH
jgi:hypothetical protein